MPPPWLWNFKVSDGSCPALVPTGGAAGGWEAKCSLMVLWCTGSGALFAVANSEVKTNSVNLLWQEVKMGKHIRWIYSSSLFAALLFILMKFVKMMHHLQMWAKNFTLLFVVSRRKGKIFNNVRNIIFAATIAVNYLPIPPHQLFHNFFKMLGINHHDILQINNSIKSFNCFSSPVFLKLYTISEERTLPCVCCVEELIVWLWREVRLRVGPAPIHQE